MTATHRFRYTPFYCEENIWHLAQEECFRGQETYAVLISGKGPYRRLWFQGNAKQPDLPVLWDYHAILLSYRKGWWVWDLDTTLGLPVSADTYFARTFLRSNLDAKDADVILRLIQADEYVERFSSDRSHMKLPSGAWAAPPPEWPMIQNERESNLLDWLDISKVGPGQVLTLAEFVLDSVFCSDHQVTGSEETRAQVSKR